MSAKIKIFIVGINGRMGQAVVELASLLKHFSIAGGLDLNADFAKGVFSNTKDINTSFDCIIDFSNPSSLNSVVELATKHNCPVVLATTGYNDSELKQISDLSKKVPVFLSGNMSYGILVMQRLVEQAVKAMWSDFDVEILEKHHNQKVDSPSGTAKMLADTVKEAASPKPSFIYGREGTSTKRKPCEVGVHAVRGGTVVGEHEVSFYGNDEIISITHTALSRKIFADGALRASLFLRDKKPGLYNMKNM